MILNHMRRVLYKPGMPTQLVMFVTNECNLRCSHCFYHKEIKNKNSNILTIDEIEKISNNNFDLNWMAFSGGEPFLRSDLPEIVDCFLKNNQIRVFSIPTNGIAQQNIITHLEKIISNNKKFFVITFSIDGLEKTHDSIRGLRSYEKVISSLVETVRLREIYNNCFGVSVNITMTKTNQHELIELYQTLRKYNLNNITVNLPRGNLKDNTEKNIDIQIYINLISLIEDDLQNGVFPEYNYSFRKLAYAKNKEVYGNIVNILKNNRSLPCQAGVLHAVINEIGVVSACEQDGFSMGSLRGTNYDFRSVWYSKQSHLLREKIKYTQCTCTYECAISANVLYSFSFYKNLIKNIFR